VRRTERTERPIYGVHAHARVTGIYGPSVRSVRRRPPHDRETPSAPWLATGQPAGPEILSMSEGGRDVGGVLSVAGVPGFLGKA
jgi:hypothetical protein